MKFVLETRNVHLALPEAITILQNYGVERDSRNGLVYQVPGGVTTIYQNPQERVLTWPGRDANPFFHLYESLWMLQGREDIAPLVRYAKNMANYSDDGVKQRGAYGYRWRKFFKMDQLAVIAFALQKDPNDRRCVLQMWDADFDLGSTGKDLPCNTIATFQIGVDGRLDMTVFCRSNDIVWGAYGANAVHFSMLLEYMANWIYVPMGTYTQVSVNWHAYQTTVAKLLDYGFFGDVRSYHNDPNFKTTPLGIGDALSIFQFNGEIHHLLNVADNVSWNHPGRSIDSRKSRFLSVAWDVLEAHAWYKESGAVAALNFLDQADQTSDWVIAAKQWLTRRIK